MIPIKIDEIAKIFNTQAPFSLENKFVESITTDSRECLENSLFVAIKGEFFDGHQFVEKAIADGSICIIVERDIDFKSDKALIINVQDSVKAMGEIAKLVRNKFSGKVLSLTGSCGKTTTKQMISSICETQFNTWCTQGNFNNYIGVPKTIFGVNAVNEILITELGANAKGEIEYLNSIVNPNVAILLNASAAHLDGFEDLESVIKTKGEIVTSSNNDTTIILNKDDESFSIWKHSSKTRKVKSFSLNDQSADIFVDNANYSGIGSTFDISINSEKLSIELHAPGKHIVQNALAAILACKELGINNENIIKGLASFKNCAGRLQKQNFENISIWDDSYNANPASIKSAVDVLALQDGIKVMVLGDMAEMDTHLEQYTKDLKQYIPTKADYLYTVGSNSNLISSDLNIAQHFENQELLVNELITLCQNNNTSNIDIMVKGSRSAKMENVVSLFATQIKEIKNDLLVN